jgi:hypothetical protein
LFFFSNVKRERGRSSSFKGKERGEKKGGIQTLLTRISALGGRCRRREKEGRKSDNQDGEKKKHLGKSLGGIVAMGISLSFGRCQDIYFPLFLSACVARVREKWGSGKRARRWVGGSKGSRQDRIVALGWARRKRYGMVGPGSFYMH